MSLFSSTRLLCLAALTLSQPALSETEVKPEHFSHLAEIKFEDVAALTVNLRLPPWVYLACRNPLRDVRVFNGDGLPVAYQIENITEASVEREFGVSAVPVTAEKPDEPAGRSADIKVDIGGKVDIHLIQQPNGLKAASPAKVGEWIIDDAQLAGTAVDRFRFELAGAEKTDFAADLSIDISDDLRNWQTVANNQRILNYGNRRISQLAIDLSPAQARYWRVRSSSEDISRIARIIVRAKAEWASARDSFNVTCELTELQDRYVCPFNGSRLPASALRFDFGNQPVAFNAVLKTYALLPELKAKKNEQSSPRQTLFQTLTNQQSAELALDGSFISGVEVALREGGKLGIKSAPKLTVFWPARVLKFYAHGGEPYRLAAGGENVTQSGEQFLENRGVSTQGRVLEPSVRQPQPFQEPEIKRPWLLWGIIAVAVLTLGGMAVSLLKQK